MTAIKSAARRLAEELPLLVNGVLHAKNGVEERAAQGRLSDELERFAETCAGQAPVDPAADPRLTPEELDTVISRLYAISQDHRPAELGRVGLSALAKLRAARGQR